MRAVAYEMLFEARGLKVGGIDNLLIWCKKRIGFYPFIPGWTLSQMRELLIDIVHLIALLGTGKLFQASDAWLHGCGWPQQMLFREMGDWIWWSIYINWIPVFVNLSHYFFLQVAPDISMSLGLDALLILLKYPQYWWNISPRITGYASEFEFRDLIINIYVVL